ncbi:putative methyltransferase C9orf114-like [Holothuria leucospilota]|uniref:28S rRNA (uridine-N(3))-methyltransferase n=1 Tax=Holothuria leucospilota TaxID=206669 RepID=A0A9Q1HBF0_HOLLE|nr:putative methyltransferase C9orf114-like [Holothuria leucospilota]
MFVSLLLGGKIIKQERLEKKMRLKEEKAAKRMKLEADQKAEQEARQKQWKGLLNPLDCPHHLRADEEFPFREGVVSKHPPSKKKGSCVQVGLTKEVRVDKQLQPGLRVTVQIDEEGYLQSERKTLKGTVVPPSLPREQQGIYWGYTVRLASSLATVFSESPYPNGYDLTVGTSEKGEHADDITLPSFKHLLVVFGGLKGLEYSLEADESLNIEEPSLLFDHYVNTCPNQGSRTIRTEVCVCFR